MNTNYLFEQKLQFMDQKVTTVDELLTKNLYNLWDSILIYSASTG